MSSRENKKSLGGLGTAELPTSGGESGADDGGTLRVARRRKVRGLASSLSAARFRWARSNCPRTVTCEK